LLDYTAKGDDTHKLLVNLQKIPVSIKLRGRDSLGSAKASFASSAISAFGRAGYVAIQQAKTGNCNSTRLAEEAAQPL
jgi:hypothetical protein